MREIKFRAWDKKNKQMLFNLENDDGENGGTLGSHCKDPNESVMQYTGLKDKNGVEVYESDIIKCMGERSEILFGISTMEGSIDDFDSNGWYRRLINPESWMKNSKNTYPFVLDADAFEVIGNIYENPELLKETL